MFSYLYLYIYYLLDLLFNKKNPFLLDSLQKCSFTFIFFIGAFPSLYGF